MEVISDQEDHTWFYSSNKDMNDFRLSIGSTSFKNKRNNNEDAVAWAVQPNLAYFIVCDGLGGHAHGEKASMDTAEFLLKEIPKILKDLDLSDKETVYDATSNLLSRAKFMLTSFPDNRDTTLVLGLLTNDYVMLFSVGDSKASFRSDEGTTEYNTTPHSYGHRLWNTVRTLSEIDFMHISLADTNEFQLILASDGMDDVLNKTWHRAQSAIELTKKACITDTDNASCIFIKGVRRSEEVSCGDMPQLQPREQLQLST